jgi:23S rRNA-/tRNA-specific pseudouridylate synthase
MPITSHQVAREDAGSKLQVFLHQKVNLSVRRVKALIDRNQCRVNGRLERFGCTPLRAGDRVELVLDDAVAPKLEVVFEDDHVLVFDKPAGVPVEKVEGGLFSHRLDRDTSGLLLFAKSRPVQEKLRELFKERQVKKRYLALVDGVPEQERGTVENRIGAIGCFAGQTIHGPKLDGQSASTYWQVAERFQRAALVRCNPETGRTHQIRVHMAGLGHPILGDGQYSRRFRCPLRVPRHMLHAERLVLPHPATGEKLVLTCPPPADFREAIKRLKCGS